MSAPSARVAPRRSERNVVAWNGPLRRYDILKEATVALVVVTILVVVLAVLFASPDEPPVTLQAWAKAQPRGFTAIALSELDGTSTSANYGPPYNHHNGSVQYLWGVSIQRAFGVTDPIKPAESFVLRPLETVGGKPQLTRALHRYNQATTAQQLSWDHRYGQVLARAKVINGSLVVPPANDGPVPEMLSAFLAMTRAGGLDAQLVEHASFYGTNYTKPILFLGDSATAQDNSYWNKLVTAEHLQGSQWGMMNETGSWPGQPWLWLYTMWYQVGPMSSSSNGDLEVVAIMTVCSIGLLFVPFIPGLRDLPRKLPVHRLIWRNYYRSYPKRPAGATRQEPR
ncbi:MAG: hypothetical protein M0004_17250 [Actinomycetota bacterium]|nr:hypothetical protein [Actinomycetota bacterium]